MIIKDEMKKRAGVQNLFCILSVFLVFLFVSSSAFCLEKMDKKALKAETGQAGLDIGISDMVIYHDRESIKFINPSDQQNNYVGLEKIKAVGTFATGEYDLDNNGIAGALSVDIGTILNNPDIETDDIPLVFLECPDWAQNLNIIIGNVNWCGKSLGSIDIKNFELPSWHAYIGAYNGAGIDFQLGFRTKIEEVRFNYGPSGESLSVKGLQVAGTFDHDPLDSVQDNPQDPSTWKASGEFKVGDAVASSPNPASIDVGLREENDGTYTPIIQLELSAKGSIRASEMKFGTQNFGPMAIDGIRVNSMRMELPGRGLGGN